MAAQSKSKRQPRWKVAPGVTVLDTPAGRTITLKRLQAAGIDPRTLVRGGALIPEDRT